MGIEEHRRMHAADSSGAFAAQFKGTPKCNNKGRKSKGYCMHCKRPGHKIEECRTLKAEHEKIPATAHVASDSIALHAQTQNNEDDPIRLFKMTETLAKHGNLTNQWLIDSRASRIMSSHQDWFQLYTQLEKPRKVWLGDNTSIMAYGVSHILIHMRMDSKWNRVILQDVLHVPNLHGNLLSVSMLAQCGA